MTPDQLIEQAKLAIRWAESVKAGKAIEVQFLNKSNNWADCTPTWDFSMWEYREKPRMRECWVALPDDLSGYTREAAERVASQTCLRAVHMREVVE